MGWRKTRFWLVAIPLLVLASLLLSVGKESASRPLDPESVEPDGTRAMTLLVRELGASFERSSSAPDRSGTALILRDDLSRDETRALEDWVLAGGTLVVADTSSSFAADVRSVTPHGRAPNELRPECDDVIASGVRAVRPERDDTYKLVKPRSPTEGTQGCFPVRDGYYVVVQRTGLGRTIIVGGTDIFTNDEVGTLDNGVLVANLLDARAGRAVTLMRTSEPAGSGRESLIALVPDRARNAIWQLALAGVVLIVWRWRRFGRPVYEAAPVEVPASSLVSAVGSLMQTGGREGRAAAILREDLHRSLAERFGLPADVPIDSLAEVAARHIRVDPERVRQVLSAAPVQTGGDLTRFAQQVEQIRSRITEPAAQQADRKGSP